MKHPERAARAPPATATCRSRPSRVVAPHGVAVAAQGRIRYDTASPMLPQCEPLWALWPVGPWRLTNSLRNHARISHHEK
jgi:hypothetical protein